ncbi:MAG: hypothetical protein K6T81_12460 [Alicyclobacillus macrosporangiidus]|uniref:hypothetical protein n=1 Tax=Alicyclobacillus macrosporangiidus TaxID=392015 RepID=UPI0026EC95A5|nr:hypothetical protein [Alicyclobacillus macrosporangiidus]MCL6599536.1 hypothetical protein [Alicyclobacillus macrosporangiidus]
MAMDAYGVLVQQQIAEQQAQQITKHTLDSLLREIGDMDWKATSYRRNAEKLIEVSAASSDLAVRWRAAGTATAYLRAAEDMEMRKQRLLRIAESLANALT